VLKSISGDAGEDHISGGKMSLSMSFSLFSYCFVNAIGITAVLFWRMNHAYHQDVLVFTLSL